MDRQYKAFISYRHLPLDHSIAKKLHRTIEHYVIPRALRKDGVKKLGYVFRDQDELPLSGNLSDNIRDALDRSEYLIVICSPETPNSKWVQREISYFSEHHDRDHILTLLIDGTPEISFPPQLTQIEQEDGTVRQVEPLAANIVAGSEAKRNRLFSSERLRILAALIGCSYDELFRREQRYKTRRILAAAAAGTALAACFIGILLNRNAAIRANYERALKNQSNYLAAESLSVLEEGDRMSAIALAMEALPKEGEDRPLVSQAEYALGLALGIYTSPGSAYGLIPKGAFHHEKTVREMLISPDEASFATISGESTVSVWDTKTDRCRWTMQLSGSSYLDGFGGFLDNDRLIVWDQSAVTCCSVSDGSLLWSTETNALPGTIISFCRACALPEADRIAVVAYRQIFLLNAADGTLQTAIDLNDCVSKEMINDLMITETEFSPDGSKVSIPVYPAYSDRSLLVLDLEKSECVCCRTIGGADTHLYRPVIFTEGGTLLYVTVEGLDDAGYKLMSVSCLAFQSAALHCMDLESGEQRWECSRTFTDVVYSVNLLRDTGYFRDPAVIWTYADKLDVIDVETGELIAETEFPSPIVGVGLFDGTVNCYTADGCLGKIVPSNPSKWYAIDSFCSPLQSATGAAGNFWVQKTGSDTVLHYAYREQDPSWRPYAVEWESEEQERDFYVTKTYAESGCFAVMDNGVLLLSDGDPAHPMRVADLSREGISRNATLVPDSVQNGRLRIHCSDNGRYHCILIDPATLETEICAWEREDMRLLYVWGDSAYPEIGGLVYIKEEGSEDPEQEFRFLKLNNRLEPLLEVSIGSFHGLKSYDSFADDAGNLYLYLPDADESYRAEWAGDSASVLPASFAEAFGLCIASGKDLNDGAVSDRSGSRLAVAVADNAIRVLQSDGSVLCTAQSITTCIYGFRFTPDGRSLLTVEADGCLRRYDAETGELLNHTALDYSGTVRSASDIEWTFPNRDFFCLNIKNCMNLIHYEDWTVYAYVPECYHYLEDEDLFCCFDYDDRSVKCYGAFPNYDLEMLLKCGREALNGWQLSETARKRYGLD